MTNDTQAPETIWIDDEAFECRWHILPEGMKPPVDYPHVFGEYTLKKASDARIAELEAAIGNALDLINADFFDEAGASLRAALGKE